MTDTYLVACAQSGDRAALDKLIRRYYDKIYSYCFHHVNDSRLAEDICQDTFCSMLEHFGEYRHEDKFQNYLYRIAGNKCKDFYKRKRDDYIDEKSENKMKTFQSEDAVLMRELVRLLPEELEEVVVLRFYQDLKYRDIAKILRITSSLAKYRVKRAVELLKKEWERSGE